MKMKKLLAAFAAATVAVSAVATSVSASVNDAYDSTIAKIPSYDSHSYNFSLVKRGEYQSGVSVEATTFIQEIPMRGMGVYFPSLKLDTAEDFTVEFNGKATNPNSTDGKSININHSYTTDVDSKVGYDADLKEYFEILNPPVPVAPGATLYPAKYRWYPSFVEDGYSQFTGTISIRYTSTKETVTEFNEATGGNKDFCMAIAIAGSSEIRLKALTTTSVKEGKKSNKSYPFFTADNAVNPATPDFDNNVFDSVPYDVIERIIRAGNNGKAAPYAAVAINDLLANYNDVTVTFATARQKVEIVSPSGDEQEANYYANSSKTAIDYTVFGQNMFGMWGDDQTGYYGIPGFNWTNSNLFSAALVVNGDLTMAYNDVVAMEYGKKEITFNLTDILNASGYGQAGAPGYGSSMYTGYVRTMQLMTTTDWYWDSVTFNGTQIAAAGDAGAGEGMEDAGDSLEETPVETTVAEIIVAPEETTAAPAVEALPETGSAPIALAVIPVAVAAAAIVAKKRK